MKLKRQFELVELVKEIEERFGVSAAAAAAVAAPLQLEGWPLRKTEFDVILASLSRED